MAELIQKEDTLNQGRVKLNNAILDAEKAKNDAATAKEKAETALANSESTQQQLDTIVIEGDSSVEAAQARVSSDGTTYSTLKQRLDTEYDELSSRLAETVERLSSTEIVVKPNGVDDSDNIQMAINDLNSMGGGVLHLENGIYHISKPIILYSYISIIGKGQGTVIRASENFTDGRFRGMLDLVSVEGVILKDIFLDHNGSNRIEGMLSHTILMLNASKCRLENLTLSDCGSTTSIPTGPALAIIAKDLPTERSGETADVYSDVIGSSSDNIVRNCRFESTKSARVAFAVRVLTNWSDQRPLEDFIHHAERNVFDSCEFIGDFPWDTLEIAGGGSRYNKVTNCSFVGMTKTAIDFDKGANFNIAIGNTVVGAGIIDDWLDDPTQRMAAINIHGTGYPSELNYPCIGNIVSNNIIRNIGNVDDTDIYQSAISVGYSKDTIIEGNQIDGIISPDRGVGIFIDHHAETVVISKNVIRNTVYGIRENAAATSVSNIIISDNDIKCRRSGIYLDSSSSHECKIVGNKIETEIAEAYNTRVVRVGYDGILISGNTVIGGRDGITVEAKNSIVSNNIVKNAANFSFRVGANSTVYLIGNLSFNAGFLPYTKSSSATIVDSANNFTVTQDG